MGVGGGGEWKLAEEVYYFAGVGVALGAGLGVDFAVVGGDFEAAFFASDEGEGFELVTEFLYDFCRQTDGSWSVVSFLAVEDLYFHVVCLLGWVKQEVRQVRVWGLSRASVRGGM